MKRAYTIILAMAVTLGLLAVGCGGDGDDNPVDPDGPADVTIHIRPSAMAMADSAYLPPVASVAIGQRVRWINDDGMAHSATADNLTFDTNLISPNGGGSPVITMTGPTGARGYHCKVNGHNMTGTLNVTP